MQPRNAYASHTTQVVDGDHGDRCHHARCAVPQAGAQTPTARSIAREAFVYGLPIVAIYETLCKQAVDREGTDFKAPFNAIGHSFQVAKPQDKQFVTPNSDTPYSYVRMDLRAEPVVITMPKIVYSDGA
ncbi:MAG: DUF1254 domain-containing protein [Betaproteobacteria bacterium]|nr:DUF1254 domain-containing protein [Betaproteobacteria bacterium]